MALDANVLASLISANMQAIEASYQNGDKSPADAHLALAQAIITHITTSAVVNTSDGATGVIT